MDTLREFKGTIDEAGKDAAKGPSSFVQLASKSKTSYEELSPDDPKNSVARILRAAERF
jgi:hypothetical protein